MNRFAAKARVAVAAAAALGAHHAAAGVLDDLRAIDINDYAIGLGASYSSGVYVDQESSSYLYPYVTKYTPMEFDESVLMMRAGGYGVRWLGDSGWEAGALARPQTLGFGANSSASLDGLDDRGWTVEVGPTLGWRSRSIRVDWTVYGDLLGHHGGTNQLLRLSRPFLFLKSYVVPELGLNHYSSDYVDYYFGVPPTNVGAASPYVGTSASGPSLAVQWGVRVAPHWLVTGKIAVESLGSGITESPIVAADERRSVSLRFAYDGTLFDELAQPQWDNEHERSWRVGLALTVADVDADASLEPTHPSANARREFSTKATLVNAEASILFAQRHRVNVGWFRALHEDAEDLSQTELSIRDFQLTYGYDLIRDAQKTVTLLAGVHIGEFSVDAPDGAATDGVARSTIPLPVVGASAAARFMGNWSANADLRAFLLHADRYSGYQAFARFALLHQTFRRTQLGVGYVFNRVALDSDEGDFGARLVSTYQGPSLVVLGSF